MLRATPVRRIVHNARLMNRDLSAASVGTPQLPNRTTSSFLALQQEDLNPLEPVRLSSGRELRRNPSSGMVETRSPGGNAYQFLVWGPSGLFYPTPDARA